MVKTKCIYSPKEESDGLRILITRFHPRGIKKNYYDLWDKRLSPSKELLQDWKQEKVNENEYTERFIIEMQNEESQKTMKLVSEIAQFETVTLLCIEKEGGSFCHRHILNKLIDAL